MTGGGRGHGTALPRTPPKKFRPDFGSGEVISMLCVEERGRGA